MLDKLIERKEAKQSIPTCWERSDDQESFLELNKTAQD